jgi:hypothetical protein
VAKDLDAVENWVADVNASLAIYRQSSAVIRVVQIYGTAKVESGIEDLNAWLAYIEHEKFACSYHHLSG